MDLIRRRIAAVLLLSLLTAGCGSSDPTGPKENLTDEDKQQVEELHQQRQDEWGKTPKGR